MVTTAPAISDSPVTKWSYVAEGGANLVIAYNSDESQYADKVLRLRKRKHGAPELDPEVLAREDPSIAFTDKVVIPLLPENATPRLSSVSVNRAWMQAISDHVEPFRPAARRALDKVDIDRKYAVLSENLAGTPAAKYEQLSVEIKVANLCPQPV